uniref:Uncharacterized protein n=1 Tax=Romanomermis culicivorax TaxID=13658 RepID=A0A915IMV5_ROMCU
MRTLKYLPRKWAPQPGACNWDLRQTLPTLFAILSFLHWLKVHQFFCFLEYLNFGLCIRLGKKFLPKKNLYHVSRPFII